MTRIRFSGRACIYRGEYIKGGTVREVPDAEAAVLVQARAAEYLADPLPAPIEAPEPSGVSEPQAPQAAPAPAAVAEVTPEPKPAGRGRGRPRKLEPVSDG